MVKKRQEKIVWSKELANLVRPLTARLNKEAILAISDELDKSIILPAGIRNSDPEEVAQVLQITLFRLLKEWRGEDDALYRDIVEWRELYYRTEEGEDRNQVLIRAIDKRSRSRSEKSKDISALGRKMDWEAMEERLAIDHWNIWRKQLVVIEVIHGLHRYGIESKEGLSLVPDPSQFMETVSILVLYLETGRHFMLRRAAVRALIAMAVRMPENGAKIYEKYSNVFYTHLNKEKEDRWVKLGIVDLYGQIHHSEAERELVKMMEDSDESDDKFLFRAHAINALVRDETGHNKYSENMRKVYANIETSEYTRLATVKGVSKLVREESLGFLLELAEIENSRSDSSEIVKSRIVEAISHIISEENTNSFPVSDAIRYLSWWISRDTSDLVRKVAQEEVALLIPILKAKGFDKDCNELIKSLSSRLSSELDSGEAERVAGLLEQIRIEFDENLFTFREDLEKLISSIKWGAVTKIRRPANIDSEDIMRVAASISRKEAGIYIEPKEKVLKVQKGEGYHRTFWRVAHEFRNLQPTGRPDVSHIRGRKNKFNLRAHPELLAEVNPTQVPGERRYIESEHGWARYLPSIDDLIQARKPIKLFSSLGVTEINPPKSWFARINVRFALAWDYAKWNSMRYDSIRHNELRQKKGFLNSLKNKLGYQVNFTPWKYELHNISVDLSAKRIMSYFEEED